ncbi:MAG: hypothetical protein ACREQ4_07110 [Candidatus Binataceae bacterium]
MIADLIYNNPTWLWAPILIVLITGLACLGLVIFHRLVRLEVRRAHNELAGFMFAAISVTYAVLLAFIAIATWESYTHAEQIVDLEADYVGSIYRDTQGLPPDVGASIRGDARLYIKTVIHDEWPAQQAGQTPTQAWEPLRRLHSVIVTMHPFDIGEAVIQAELLRTLNGLYRARATRLSAAQGHVPEMVWWIVFAGAGVVILFTYLFGFHDFRMHLVMTSAIAISMALVVVLIIALDWPFRGEVSVSPEAFIKTQQSWHDLPFDKSRNESAMHGTRG